MLAFTEDDRHARPALPDARRHGGRVESKLESGQDSLFPPEAVDERLSEHSVNAPKGQDEVRASGASPGPASSLRRPFQAVSVPQGDEEDTSGEHNAQVAKMISALGENGAGRGRRVVPRATAERQGKFSEEEVDEINK